MFGNLLLAFYDSVPCLHYIFHSSPAVTFNFIKNNFAAKWYVSKVSKVIFTESSLTRNKSKRKRDCIDWYCTILLTNLRWNIRCANLFISSNCKISHTRDNKYYAPLSISTLNVAPPILQKCQILYLPF